jgi:LytS/YehU family sensor histidine kinase
LQNVKKRLKLLYPDRHELRIVAEEETFRVTLMLELVPTLVSNFRPADQLAETA